MSTAHNLSSGLSRAQDARGLDSAPTAYASYQIDPAATRVEFTIHKRLFLVRHMVVTGRFADVQGIIALDEREPANSRADVLIGAASLNTQMGASRLQTMQATKRDAHLRKADFFDVERHPQLSYKSRHIEAIDRVAGRYRVTGDLTLRNVAREVILDAVYSPAISTGTGRRIKLTLQGSLNRRDFGLVWNRPYLAIADDLTVAIELEATRV